MGLERRQCKPCAGEDTAFGPCRLAGAVGADGAVAVDAVDVGVVDFVDVVGAGGVVGGLRNVLYLKSWFCKMK